MMGIRRSLAELQAEEHRALTRHSALAREGAELFIQPGENEHKAKESLLGRSDEPATLAGQRPIGLAEATDLASEAPSLVRILTHPVSKLVLSVDTYRPSEQMRRFLRIRDSHCRFPGCPSPPSRCDLDHTVPAEEGGPTKADNLAHLCRGDHTLKHHGGWSVKQTQPGVLEWTSSNGFTHIDRPEPTVSFAA